MYHRLAEPPAGPDHSCGKLGRQIEISISESLAPPVATGTRAGPSPQLRQALSLSRFNSPQSKLHVRADTRVGRRRTARRAPSLQQHFLPIRDVRNRQVGLVFDGGGNNKALPIRGEEYLLLDLADFINRTNVRVIERRSGLRLSMKVSIRFLIAQQVQCERLESDRAIKLRVLGLVDHAHAALAEPGSPVHRWFTGLGSQIGRSFEDRFDGFA